MICPNCKTEYAEEMENCPICNVPLVASPEEADLSDWEIAFTTDFEYEADMLKANLEGAGIKSFVIKQKDSSFPAVGNLAVIKLFVQREKLNQALEIIKDINNQTPDAGNE